MKNLMFLLPLFLLISKPLFSQKHFPKQAISINGFRNPSVGIEIQYQQLSYHVGYYPTVISKNDRGSFETTSFVRSGTTFWYLPIGKRDLPTSAYSSLSLVFGLNKKYKNQLGILMETGVRWMVGDHFNFRTGAAVLLSKGHKAKVNPTPGISYTYSF